MNTELVNHVNTILIGILVNDHPPIESIICLQTDGLIAAQLIAGRITGRWPAVRVAGTQKDA